VPWLTKSWNRNVFSWCLKWRKFISCRSQSRPTSVTASAEPRFFWLLADVLLHTARNLAGQLTGLTSGLSGSYSLPEIRPGVSPNQEFHCRTRALSRSCNSATVSMETVQVVLDRYQTFHPQSVWKQTMILSAKNHWQPFCSVMLFRNIETHGREVQNYTGNPCPSTFYTKKNKWLQYSAK